MQDGPCSAPHAQQGASAWTVEQLSAMDAAWQRSLALPLAERNRLLGRRMKAATAIDPFAYDLVKQDTKEFM